VNSVSASTTVGRGNPWPGLASFTEDQRAFFHGREAETAELFRLIRRAPLTVLFGQSGLGKSSLLQAGVFPLLREADLLPVPVRLDHAPDAPTLSAQVFRALATTFSLVGAEAPALRADETLWEYFHRSGAEIWSPRNRLLTPVLVFDQFEELFTLGRSSEASRQRGRAFVTELADLVENRPPLSLRARIEQGELDPAAFNHDQAACHVLLSLREDFLPELEGLRDEMRSVQNNRYRLRRLDCVQALAIVTRPAPELVSPEVAEKIVAFVAGTRGGSPERLVELEVEPALLSVVCRELNQRRLALGQSALTADLVAGNRSAILVDFYERSLADLPPTVRLFVEDRLLTRSGYRDNLALETALAEPGVTRDHLDTLVARRLLRLEDRLGVVRVELTHDVLAEVIRLSRDARHTREAQAAEEARLRAAEQAVTEARAREASARRQTRRARLIAAGCAVLALAAAGSAVFGYVSMRRAQAAETLSRDTRDRAEQLLDYIAEDLREELAAIGRLPLLLSLANKAVAYYEGLPPAARDRRVLENHALAYVRVADVQFDQGAIDASFRILATARQLLAQAAATDPAAADGDSARWVRSQLLRVEGRNFNNRRDFRQAVQTHRAALAELTPLLQRPSPSPRVVFAAAEILRRTATSLGNLNDPAALQSGQQGVALLEALAQTAPQTPNLDAELGKYYAGLAAQAVRVGEPGLGRPLAVQALAKLEQALAADPLNRSLQFDKGNASYVLGMALANTGGSLADQQAAARAGVQQFQELAGIDPSNATVSNQKGIAESRLSRTLVRTGTLREARQTLEPVTRPDAAGLSEIRLANQLGYFVSRIELHPDIDDPAALAGEHARFKVVLEEFRRRSTGESFPSALFAAQSAYFAVRAETAFDPAKAVVIGQQGLAQLARVVPANPDQASDLTRRDNMLRLGTALAAVRAGQNSEAEALFRTVRQRLSLGQFPGLVLPILGLGQFEPPIETNLAFTEMWLARLNAQDGRRPDAEVLAWAEHAATCFRQLHAANDPGDHVHRYLAAFAEIALARARLVAGGADPAVARAGLDAAEAHLAAMSAEFQATPWIKDLRTWLAATRTLLP
jgi:hypothetical protein